MNRKKEAIYTIEEIKLFYNDIKYVTRSLAKESEEFFSCIFSYAQIERKDPKGIEDFLCKEEQRLKKIESELYQLFHIQKKGKRKYGILEWKNFNDLKDILDEFSNINRELKPSSLWFSKDNYDVIHDMLDDVQTKVEDSETSKERINQFWSDDVLLPHNVRFAMEYVDMLNGAMKYFNTNFWKYRKQLKTLFIGDDVLFHDDEIKLLKKNVAIMTENDNWLFFKKRKITDVLGENYIGKETDFNQLRKNYEIFYTWLLRLPEGYEFTEETFTEYCDFIEQLSNIDWKSYYNTIQKSIPFFSEEMIRSTPIGVLIEKIQNYQQALKIIKQKYGISYLLEERTDTSYEKWNKLLQKILEKYKWIQDKRGEIQSYFGGIYAGFNTDWDLMKDCIMDSTKEINGILERKIKQYQFVICQGDWMEDGIKLNQVETVEQAMSCLLKNEYSIAVSELVKKCCKLLGQKRVTAKLKQEVELYMEERLSNSFYVKDNFIVIKEKEALKFRIPADKMKRDVETISMEECIVGVYNVIRVEQEIPLDDLTKIFAKLLGYPRRTKLLQEKIEEAVKCLKQDDKIVRKSGGWSLIEM